MMPYRQLSPVSSEAFPPHQSSSGSYSRSCQLLNPHHPQNLEYISLSQYAYYANARPEATTFSAHPVPSKFGLKRSASIHSNPFFSISRISTAQPARTLSTSLCEPPQQASEDPLYKLARTPSTSQRGPPLQASANPLYEPA